MRSGPALRARPGLTLVEVAVSLAIVLILAVAVLGSVRAAQTKDEVAHAIATLEEILVATIYVHGDNQDYPSIISHMSTPITTSDRNFCGNTYSPGKVGNWDGPYIDFVMPRTGLPLGIGTIPDTVIRNLIGGNAAYMIIRIDAIDEENAAEIERLVEADDDPSGGTVLWSTPDPGTGLTTLQYRRRVIGC